MIPILTGPTGVGKTTLSIQLAEALGGEIISIDSRQVYKELEIGTAKPSEHDLAKVPHHFISELSIKQAISAGEFSALAEDRIAQIISRNKTPIVVGGSPMYIQALQYGLADIPAITTDIRAELDERLKREGSHVLYAELLSVDPISAYSMDATKSQRIVRALEVYHGTGTPLSVFHQNHKKPAYSYTTFVLHRNRELLYSRINERVDIMLEMGLVKEVKSLLHSGIDPTLPILRTIGYKEIIDHLHGMYDFKETVRLIKRNSRRYAKRQLTWFKRFPEYIWIDLGEEEQPHKRILQELRTAASKTQRESD